MKNIWYKVKDGIVKFILHVLEQSEWIWFGVFLFNLIKFGVGSWVGILTLGVTILCFRNALRDLIQAKIDENFCDEEDNEEQEKNEIQTVETMIIQKKE
jgi:hypothetical protein